MQSFRWPLLQHSSKAPNTLIVIQVPQHPTIRTVRRNEVWGGFQAQPCSAEETHFWDSSGVSPMSCSPSPDLPYHGFLSPFLWVPSPGSSFSFFFLFLCIRRTGFFSLMSQFLPLCSPWPRFTEGPSPPWMSCRQQHIARSCQSRQGTCVCTGSGEGTWSGFQKSRRRGSLGRRRRDCREDKLLGDWTPTVWCIYHVRGIFTQLHSEEPGENLHLLNFPIIMNFFWD